MAPAAREARRLLREAREDRTGPPLRLLLNDHCQVCEFRGRCHAEATAKDDLSLLRGMSQKEISKYGRRGIFTHFGIKGRPPGSGPCALVLRRCR